MKAVGLEWETPAITGFHTQATSALSSTVPFSLPTLTYNESHICFWVFKGGGLQRVGHLLVSCGALKVDRAQARNGDCDGQLWRSCYLHSKLQPQCFCDTLIDKDDEVGHFRV